MQGTQENTNHKTKGQMKKILLSGKRGEGKFVCVDDEDYLKYHNLKWHLSDTGYAMRRNNHKTERLHRLIMNAPDGMVVDHLNGNKFDCRKANLRVCSQRENAKNCHGVKGYAFDKNRGKWLVYYRRKFYGRYETEAEAKKAYRNAKSGKPYELKFVKHCQLLPTNISQRSDGKYVVGVQRNGVRKRKVGFSTVAEAKKYLEKLKGEMF